jgi:hypothetical protein
VRIARDLANASDHERDGEMVRRWGDAPIAREARASRESMMGERAIAATIAHIVA